MRTLKNILPLLLILSACSKIDQMNNLVQNSTCTIYENVQTVQASTAIIEQNKALIESSTATIEENKKLLQKMSES